tara:strand:+ start:409 stop:573 length:165 start_codon:yes stop_codon:yes gene_type:complete
MMNVFLTNQLKVRSGLALLLQMDGLGNIIKEIIYAFVLACVVAQNSSSNGLIMK